MQRHGQREHVVNNLYMILAGTALFYILLPTLLQYIGLELGLVNTRIDLNCSGEIKNNFFKSQCTVYKNRPMQEFSHCMNSYRIMVHEDRYSVMKQKTNIAAWFEKTEFYKIPFKNSDSTSPSIFSYTQHGSLSSCAKKSNLRLNLIEKIAGHSPKKSR